MEVEHDMEGKGDSECNKVSHPELQIIIGNRYTDKVNEPARSIAESFIYFTFSNM